MRENLDMSLIKEKQPQPPIADNFLAGALNVIRQETNRGLDREGISKAVKGYVRGFDRELSFQDMLPLTTLSKREINQFVKDRLGPGEKKRTTKKLVRQAVTHARKRITFRLMEDYVNSHSDVALNPFDLIDQHGEPLKKGAALTAKKASLIRTVEATKKAKERGEEKVRVPTFVEMVTRRIDEEAKTVDREIKQRMAAVTKTSEEQPWWQKFVASVKKQFGQLVSRPGGLGTIQRRLVFTAGLILTGILAKEGATFLLNHLPSNRIQAAEEELNLFPPARVAELPVEEAQAYPAPKKEQPVLGQVKKPGDFQVGTSLEKSEKKAPEVNLSRDYVPPLIKIKASEGIKTTPGKEIQAQPQAAEALKKLFAAAQKDGLDDLSIGSGYRSYDYQFKLYQAAVSKYGEKQAYVAAPGKSQHQTGDAFDFTTPSIGYRIDTDAGFEKTPAGQWLAKNASRFGFVLSYDYEPWHFMYVGEIKEPLSEEEMK